LVTLSACGVQPATKAQTSQNVESTEKLMPQRDGASIPFQEPERQGASFTLQQGQKVTVKNELGDVRLRFGGYTHQLEVTSVAQAPASFAFAKWRFDAKTASLDTALVQTTPAQAGQRIDIVVWIPKNHDVSVQTLDGLVEVRGLMSNVTVRSNSGGITARGVQGSLDLQTGAGAIEVSVTDVLAKGLQRLVTSTGVITAAFHPEFRGDLALASSGLFASEFSTTVSPQIGKEPNKTAAVRIGEGNGGNQFEISSKRGEIRLYRGVEYVEAGE
jgi:hypothetical protein